MKIDFTSKKLKKIFDSPKELIKKYGKQQAEKIQIRMEVLRAAEDLSEIPTHKPERCHQLEGNRKHEFSIDLLHPFRLIFRPKKLSKDGVYDLSSIKSIVIISVEDTHD